jgi:hypothetical protein
MKTTCDQAGQVNYFDDTLRTKHADTIYVALPSTLNDAASVQLNIWSRCYLDSSTSITPADSIKFYISNHTSEGLPVYVRQTASITPQKTEALGTYFFRFNCSTMLPVNGMIIIIWKKENAATFRIRPKLFLH